MSRTHNERARRIKPAQIVLIPALAAALYFLLPVWWLLVATTKSDTELFSTFGFWFASNNVGDNLGALFAYKDGIYFTWLRNSVIYAGGGALVATIVAAMAGYALAKLRFRGKGVLFGIVLAGLLLPAPLLTIPLYLVNASVGLSNTMAAVLIPSFVSPLGLFLARLYADSAIPDEIIEAARMDGAGEVRIFATLALRIMSPALVTIFLFQAVSIWNNFFLPLVMLADEKLYPVTLGIYTIFTRPFESNYGLVITGSLLAVIPLAVSFFFLQRYWRTGLTLGGVKA